MECLRHYVNAYDFSTFKDTSGSARFYAYAFNLKLKYPYLQINTYPGDNNIHNKLLAMPSQEKVTLTKHRTANCRPEQRGINSIGRG